jgi:predicted MPP superfamily phosphohydrolase
MMNDPFLKDTSQQHVQLSHDNEMQVRNVDAARQFWQQRRSLMEKSEFRYSPTGVRRIDAGDLFERALDGFELALKATGLFRVGNQSAKDVRLKQFELSFDNLPDEFDGYTILHLTDLHIDHGPEIENAIVKAVDGISADICVMTGDYRAANDGPHEQIINPMARLLDAINIQDGTYAVLGNHDDHKLGLSLEKRLGVRLLANEQIVIERNQSRLRIAGADDVNRFYTADAAHVLSTAQDDFGIALVHSPEMANEAAQGGYSLYLCGHTHGGQVCLPGGKPLVTHLTRNRDLASGLWRVGSMTGYTSPGAGISGPAVRFFSRGEVTLITLRKSSHNLKPVPGAITSHS